MNFAPSKGNKLKKTAEQFIPFVSGKFSYNYYGPKTGTFNGSALYSGLQQETIKYTLTNGSRTYSWYPGPNNGATVYVLNYQVTTPTKENGFWKWMDMPNQTHFHTTFWGIDTKGNILGAIASEKPLSELDDMEVRMLALYHIAVALNNTNVTNVGFDVFLQTLAKTAGNGTPPYIQIQR